MGSARQRDEKHRQRDAQVVSRCVFRTSSEVTVNGEQEKEILSNFKEEASKAIDICAETVCRLGFTIEASRVAQDEFYREGKGRIEEEHYRKIERGIREAQEGLKEALQALQEALQALQEASAPFPPQKTS